MPKTICPICFDDVPISRMLFIKCGHGFCIECTKRNSREPNCAVCRVRKTSQPHQIFVDFCKPDFNIRRTGTSKSDRNSDGPAKLSYNIHGQEELKSVFEKMEEMLGEEWMMKTQVYKLEKKVEFREEMMKTIMAENILLRQHIAASEARLAVSEAKATLSKHQREDAIAVIRAGLENRQTEREVHLSRKHAGWDVGRT